MKLKLQKHRVCLILLAAIVIFILCNLAYSKYGLTTTCYKVSSPKLTDQIRIVQLTDLHNSEFGSDNKRLIERVREENPDLILMTGDMLNSFGDNTDIAVHLVKSLSEIAPVYYSYGNHEVEYEQKYHTLLVPSLESAGAVILDKAYEDILVGNQAIRLGGIYGYCVPERYLETNEADPEECSFLDDFMETDSFTLLLCHMPYTWLVLNGLEEWNIDCVMCGHIHGGQIRLPLIGGLWAPDQGWFPGWEAGLYYSDNRENVMVLSRGLGSTERIPRFLNVPEIIVVDIVPES